MTKTKTVRKQSARSRVLYFAYGSNLHVEQMKRRAPGARPVVKAELRDHELVFRGVADVTPKRGSTVPGALWSLTMSDFRALDRYEGYPSLYGRQQVDLKTTYGPVRAWVYHMKRDRHQAYPSEWYLRTIKEGYEVWGLPDRTLVAAVKRVRTWMDENGLTDDDFVLGHKGYRRQQQRQYHRAPQLDDTPLDTSGMTPATLAFYGLVDNAREQQRRRPYYRWNRDDWDDEPELVIVGDTAFEVHSDGTVREVET